MQEPRTRRASPVILLVYRDLHLGRFIEHVLADEEYEVTIQHHWLEALFFESEFPYHIDLVITNLGFPNVMNGRTLACCFSATRPTTNFLFTSGGIPRHLSAPDRFSLSKEGYPARHFPVLATPFPAESLRKHVRQLIGTSKLQTAFA